MRWLLLKDLQILRRSPLLVGLLVVYPVVVSLLIGFALSRDAAKPKVAFVNQVSAAAETINIGGESLDATSYADRLFEAVDPVRVDTREEALALVRSGEVAGALVIPEDITQKLQATVALGGSTEPPTVEVVYNSEGPLQGQLVESLIASKLGEANQALSGELTRVAADYLGILLRGGSFSILGRDFDVLGLQNVQRILAARLAELPADAPERAQLEQVRSFAELAVDNLDLSEPVLNSISAPIAVETTVLSGSRTPLDDFAVAVAIAISLMFVTVLLAAGMLALEREEHVFSRLVRGLVSHSALLAEKAGLAALCAFAVTALMLVVVGAFTGLDFARAPQWAAALAAGAVAFGALGVALGSLAREVRAASLLAFLLTLPLAFLALVPSSAVSGGLFTVVEVVSALFPFKPTLQALDAAINDADPGLLRPVAHLLALALGFGIVARLALRRFA